MQCKSCGKNIEIADENGLCINCSIGKSPASVQDSIQQLLEATRVDPVLGYAFVHWNIQREDSTGKLIGGLAFGLAGYLTMGKEYFTGYCGLLVVSSGFAKLYYFHANFSQPDARIHPPHIDYFLKNIGTASIADKQFDLTKTQVFWPREDKLITRITSAGETLNLVNSPVYLETSLQQTPTLVEAAQLMRDQGTLIDPGHFIDQLRTRIDPVPVSSQDAMCGDNSYLNNLTKLIRKQSDSEYLISNLKCLAPEIQSAIKRFIEAKAANCKTNLIWTVILLNAFLVAVVLVIMVPDLTARVSIGIGALIVFGFLSDTYPKYSFAKWCLHLVRSGQTTALKDVVPHRQ